MLIGSGLLAQAFMEASSQHEDVCIYAAGVSSSICVDPAEFGRERLRLSDALQKSQRADAFVYFGTCSVDDPEARLTAYVLHKLGMEQLVRAHPRHLILRLPQVAGRTPNPHTLLNFLYARISRSESFTLWRDARRNVIDAIDVAAIAGELIAESAARNVTVNVANPVSYTMAEIVSAMERAVGKRAIFDIVERGSQYFIDVRAILPAIERAGVIFGDGYLERVIGKYYGSPR